MNKAVANKSELITLLRNNSEQIRGYGVRKLSLFGSFQRDTGIHEESDVDFIVDFDQDLLTFRGYMALAEFLEDLLGRKVEMIQPQYLSRFLSPHVLNVLEDVGLETTSG